MNKFKMTWWKWIGVFIFLFWLGWAIAANIDGKMNQLIGRTLMFFSIIVISGITIHRINHPKKVKNEQGDN